MTVIALLLLLAQLAPAAAEASPALRCLPTRDGFVTMRLRGSIEQDIHWTEPALECTGMSRPDGKGLRLRFAGSLAGGELAVVEKIATGGAGLAARQTEGAQAAALAQDRDLERAQELELAHDAVAAPVAAGARLRIETPGGGGFGAP